MAIILRAMLHVFLERSTHQSHTVGPSFPRDNHKSSCHVPCPAHRWLHLHTGDVDSTQTVDKCHQRTSEDEETVHRLDPEWLTATGQPLP